MLSHLFILAALLLSLASHPMNQQSGLAALKAKFGEQSGFGSPDKSVIQGPSRPSTPAPFLAKPPTSPIGLQQQIGHPSPPSQLQSFPSKQQKQISFVPASLSEHHSSGSDQQGKQLPVIGANLSSQKSPSIPQEVIMGPPALKGMTMGPPTHGDVAAEIETVAYVHPPAPNDKGALVMSNSEITVKFIGVGMDLRGVISGSVYTYENLQLNTDIEKYVTDVRFQKEQHRYELKSTLVYLANKELQKGIGKVFSVSAKHTMVKGDEYIVVSAYVSAQNTGTSTSNTLLKATIRANSKKIAFHDISCPPGTKGLLKVLAELVGQGLHAHLRAIGMME